MNPARALEMASSAEIYDVAIVGYGPVGAVAANLLGRAGVRTLVIERGYDIYDKPRALALDHEIARVLQGLGLGDAIEPHVAPFTASEYFGASGQLIKRLDMVPPPYPQAWTPSMVFMQPAVELLLREAAANAAPIDVRLGQTVHTVTQSDGHVVLAMRDEHGRESTATARYVIACDGANSTLRQLLSIDLEDLGFDQPWLVVDVIANARGLEKLPRSSVQYCEPQQPATFVIGTGAHRRWEIMLNEDEDAREAEQPDNVWHRLSRWITPDDGQLWRSASYRFHALVAREWQSGRIFLAGDAAHQQPPFLGQGFCQGVRDVANLCWKLDRVLRGHSGPALLHSYGAERAPHVRKLTSIIKSIGSLIAERDPARAAERDARLIAEAGGTVQSVPRQDLMPGLGSGLLAVARKPGVGALFPQPRVLWGGSTCRFDDVFKPGFLVVLGSAFQQRVSPEIRELCAKINGQMVRFSDETPHEVDDIPAVRETEDVVHDWLAKHDSTAAIVRPDHYVFALSSTHDELTRQLHELAASLIGHLRDSRK
jgi:3-(3-hydroxy-phenyl)propionate hydroxylase